LPSAWEAYAAAIMRLAGVRDPRVEAAFAAVPREDFAGPPPWRIGSGSPFGLTSADDPERLYEDVLVGIDLRRGINNGQPSLHAQSIAALGLREGETVVQIGAGAGYYTAILATLVGAAGRVIAYEIEPDIAERAAATSPVTLRSRSAPDPASRICPQPTRSTSAPPPRIRFALGSRRSIAAGGCSSLFKRPARPAPCS